MRLFIGLPLSREAGIELARISNVLKSRTTGSFSNPGLYHVTLAFLGELDSSQIPVVRQAIRNAADRSRRFSLQLTRLGFFSSPQSATLWCTVAGQPALSTLAGALAMELRKAGLPFDDKPFKAHITLGRKINLEGLNLRETAVSPVVFPVETVVLFESTRIDGRLKYIPVETVRLG